MLTSNRYRKIKYRKNISIYVHWPYCASICPYCDFNKYLSRDVDDQKMQSCLITELETGFHTMITPSNSKLVSSIFFGGGTPSLAEPSTIAAIISWVRDNCQISESIEITMETNPSMIESGKLKLFKEAGVNRISLGVQALDDDDLRYLGRKHIKKEAIYAIETAKSIFESVSIDLMYGRHKGQTAVNWRRELAYALSFNLDHISLYNLTIEQGTPFFRSHKSNNLFLPDDDVVSDMYDICIEESESAGLFQYEVSNFSKPGNRSIHNMNYWNNGDYFGIGPGAASRITNKENKIVAISMLKNPNKWMNTVKEKGMGVADYELLSTQSQVMESIMFGLRSVDGISSEAFKNISDGKHFTEVLRIVSLRKYVKEGYLETDQNYSYLRASQKGLKILDSIISEVVE